MNGNFKVGEVLVGQNFINDTSYNGMECTVTSCLQSVDGYTAKGEFKPSKPRYGVMFADGKEVWVAPFYLRRKQPPTGEASILNMFVVAPPKRIKEPA